MSDEWVAELKVLQEVILQAGAEVKRRYASFAQIADAPADITTEVDKISQEIILQELQQRFPLDGLCAEEATATAQAASTDPPSGRWWVVDPIDGTRGFARKNDEFSIMIGLVQDGKAIMGAVYEPAIDRLTLGLLGRGCWYHHPSSAEAVTCTVRTTDSLQNATMAMSRSQGEEGEKRLLGLFGAKDAVQTYSAGIKLAQVARGEADLYLGDYPTLRDWDICAGHVLVEAAGGTVTTTEGQPIFYSGTGTAINGKGLIATNGPLHPASLEILKHNDPWAKS